MNTRPAHFTTRAFIDTPSQSLDVYHAPDADTDGTFQAWCNDEQEMITINGWQVFIWHEND